MLKKISLVLLFLFIGVLLFLVFPQKSNFSSQNCPFCDSKILNLQSFYEDDLVIALTTHRPIFPGHCLVIPKRHVERFENLSNEEADQIFKVLKKVNSATEKVFSTSSYLLLQKNGWESGQSVPHVHFHYIPRIARDGSIFKFFFHMIWANLGKPISAEETEKITTQMRESMNLSFIHQKDLQ